MTNDEFRDWRTRLGLTQKEAAKELGIAPITVQKYERGFRNDTKQSVKIPMRVTLACEEISRKIGKKSLPSRLLWKHVPENVIDRVRGKMREAQLCIEPHAASFFYEEYYRPFAIEIDEWLKIHDLEGHAKICVPDVDAPGGSVIVLHFFKRSDEVSFAYFFGGLTAAE